MRTFVPSLALSLILLLILLPSATPLQATHIESRGFLSQLNRFYLYLQFDAPVDNLLSDYSVDLLLENISCLDQIKLFSTQRILALGCRFPTSLPTPEIAIKFYNSTPLNYLAPQIYSLRLRNLHHLQKQSMVTGYYQYTLAISQWIGYWLLLLFILNLITYFLPLLRVVQLTALFIILDIRKPKVLDVVLSGLFNFNKYRLYQVTLETPFALVVQPREHTIFYELGVSPVFIGEQYSFLMQLCFLMLGVFGAYLLASLINILCNAQCIKYFAKRFIKDIFINTCSLYFMMHIPLGLTALIGIRFGNNMIGWRDVVEYGVNIIGVLVLWVSPGLFSGLLGLFKWDMSIHLRKIHFFGGRRRRFSEVFVVLSLLKDTLFVTSMVLFNKQLSLVLMIILVCFEISVVARSNIFLHRPVFYLKLAQQILLLLYVCLFAAFYILQELGSRLLISIQLSTIDILGYVGIGLLCMIYSIVLAQLILQAIYDYCHRCRCKGGRGEASIQNLEHDELGGNTFNLTHQPLKDLKSVWREKERIMQKRAGVLEDIHLELESAVHLKRVGNELTVPSERCVKVRSANKNRKMSCEVRLSYMGEGGGIEELVEKHKSRQKSREKSGENVGTSQKIKSKESLFKQESRMKGKLNEIYSSREHKQVEEDQNEPRDRKRPITSLKPKGKIGNQGSYPMEITSKQAIQQIESQSEEGSGVQEEESHLPFTSRSYKVCEGSTHTLGRSRVEETASRGNQGLRDKYKNRANRKGIHSKTNESDE